MIDFTSRQLRAFLLVAQHRSFSKAAGALFVTPSGLSILVREFEAQLGTRLFNRTTRRVELTRSGEELLTVARKNLQELDRAMSRIRRPEGTHSVVDWFAATNGHYRIGAGHKRISSPSARLPVSIIRHRQRYRDPKS